MTNEQAPTTSAWQPLRHGLFRSLWLASIASSIGTWMHEVGAGWLMTSLSASPFMVSLVLGQNRGRNRPQQAMCWGRNTRI